MTGDRKHRLERNPYINFLQDLKRIETLASLPKESRRKPPKYQNKKNEEKKKQKEKKTDKKEGKGMNSSKSLPMRLPKNERTNTFTAIHLNELEIFLWTPSYLRENRRQKRKNRSLFWIANGRQKKKERKRSPNTEERNPFFL